VRSLIDLCFAFPSRIRDGRACCEDTSTRAYSVESVVSSAGLVSRFSIFLVWTMRM
jgi:hypothetical protein